MGKAILFLRVSTNVQSLESQELVVRRMAYYDGYTDADILEPIQYKESAVKLNQDQREGVQELYNTIENRNDIETVYCSELSRLSRQPLVLYAIRDFLIARKIQLVCRSPQFSLLDINKKADKIGALVFAIFGAFAEQEIIEKKERFARGKEQKALENKYTGGNIPFGYMVDNEMDKLIVVKHDDAKLVRSVFDLYESGLSQPKIVKHFHRLGVSKLTISFINNILNNERYTGAKRIYTGSTYARAYPVIISKEQFARCREIAKQNNTTADKTKNIYYAHRLIVCNSCSCYFSASGSKVDYHCYDAFNVMRKYDHYTTPQCTQRICISINIMDSLLWHIAQEAEVNYILNASEEERKVYESKISDLNVKLEAIEQRLDDLNKKKERVAESYIDGSISKELKDRKNIEIDEDRRKIQQDEARFINDLDHQQMLLDGIDNIFNMSELDGIVGQLERIMALRQKIAQIVSDEERSDIIHRHVKMVKIENSELEYEFGVGKRIAKARFLSIWLHNSEVQYYYYLPVTGKGGIIIKSDEMKNAVEKIRFEYLDRFFDSGKRRRSQAIKDQRINERNTKFPSEQYLLGYKNLASFLNINISTAHRWVETKKLLKPAVVEFYNKEIVVDKLKCLDILENEANSNPWIKKIVNKLKQ